LDYNECVIGNILRFARNEEDAVFLCSEKFRISSECYLEISF
jgi:hypothetical protein